MPTNSKQNAAVLRTTRPVKTVCAILLCTLCMLCALYFFALPMEAQEIGEEASEELVTDRPDFTESAQTVAQSRFQIESGLTYERQGAMRQTMFGEVLVRVGVNQKTELRLGVPSYLIQRNGGRATGFDDAFFGAKFRLTEPEAPKGVALLVGSVLPTGSRRVAAREWQPEAVLAAELPPLGSTSLGVNVGYVRAHAGTGRFNQFLGSVALGFDVASKTGAFLEAFALSKDAPGGRALKYMDGGLTYLLDPNTQLDARIGFGINNKLGGPDFFYGVGLSRRF